MTQVPSSKTPHIATLACIAVGVIVTLIVGGFSGGLIGGLVAAAGVVPSGYGVWLGMQKESQGSLAISLLLGLAAVGVGALLLILGIVDWAV